MPSMPALIKKPSSALSTTDFLFTSNGDGSKQRNIRYMVVITCNKKGQDGKPIQIVASLPQEYQMDISASYEEAMAQAVASNSFVAEWAGKARLAGVQLTTQALTAQVWQGATEVAFSIPLVFQVESDPYLDVLRPLGQLYELVLPDDSQGNGLLQAPGPQLTPELLGKAVGSLVSGTLNTATQSAKSLGSSIASGAQSVGNDLLASLNQRFGTSLSLGDAKKQTPESAAQGKTPDQNQGPRNSLLNSIKNNISLSIGLHQHFDSVVITNVQQTHHVQPLQDGTMSKVEVQVSFKTFFVPTQKDIKNIFPRLADSKAQVR